MKIKESREDKLFNLITVTVLIVMMLLALYPLYFSLIASFSSPRAIYQGRVILFPADITLDGYLKIFSDHSIWTGYVNAIIYTAVGTFL